jgi:hypothetical protein
MRRNWDLKFVGGPSNRRNTSAKAPGIASFPQLCKLEEHLKLPFLAQGRAQILDSMTVGALVTGGYCFLFASVARLLNVLFKNAVI